MIKRDIKTNNCKVIITMQIYRLKGYFLESFCYFCVIIRYSVRMRVRELVKLRAINSLTEGCWGLKLHRSKEARLPYFGLKTIR